MPKVELHCHLEGTMRPATLVELAGEHDVALPDRVSAAGFTFDSFEGFFEVYRAIQSVLLTPADWSRLAYESVIDAARCGIVYREACFTPAKQLEDGQRLVDILAGLDEGLQAGEAETGVRVALIADIDRGFGHEAGENLVTRLIEARRDAAPGHERVLGIGMSAVELGTDPKDYAEAYRLAGDAGFHRTAHQGAEGPPSNISDAIEYLHCERIDHGLAVVDDERLAEQVKREGIPLTVCPSSNLSVGRYESLAEHPFQQMRQAGLVATLNTDDPAMIDLGLDEEFATIMKAFGFDEAAMVQIATDAVDASWLDDDDKRAIRAQIAESTRAETPRDRR